MDAYSNTTVHSTQLNNSYSATDITAGSYVGGLIGTANNIWMNQGYAIGKVDGNNFIGGAVGSAATATEAKNIYWVKETTGQTISALGINTTITNLSRKSGYTGFDFNTVWGIEEETSLAYLQGIPVPDKVYDVLKGYNILEGNGTKSSPYLIKNADQLNKVRYDMKAYYKLAADIDLKGISSWTPIGTKEEPFIGDFNGNGYTIRNMTINNTAVTTNYVGLFGYVGTNSNISNFILDNYNITAKGNYIGAVTGYNEGIIEKIMTKGNINLSGTCSHIGGIAGYQKPSASGLYSYIGKVYTEGNIGDKTTDTSYIGGIVGSLMGYSGGETKSKLINSYTTANIKGKGSVGGLVGKAEYAGISNAYAIGTVTGLGTGVGGAVGTANANCVGSNLYWAKETTTQATSALGINTTVSKLSKKIGYSGFDFTNTWNIEEGTSLAYLQGMPVPSKVYEILQGYSKIEGEGSKTSPYLIKNEQELNKVRYDMKAYYKLVADIDMSGISNWIPIGTEKDPFDGNFNGDGHSIKNMKITTTENHAGLFGYTGTNSNISNFILDNYNITAKGNYIGAVVGYNQGNIYKITTQGNILGTSSYTGGIAGYHKNDGTSSTMARGIYQVYTQGTIGTYHTSSGSYKGGIVGYMQGKSATYNQYCYVKNAYTTATVQGANFGGGIVGKMAYSSITNSYANGLIKISSVQAGGIVGNQVSSVATNVFWNIDTTMQTKGLIGIGKTTEEMKLQSTYTGFDFNTIWKMGESGYPEFQ